MDERSMAVRVQRTEGGARSQCTSPRRGVSEHRSQGGAARGKNIGRDDQPQREQPRRDNDDTGEGTGVGEQRAER